jgi:hypothetical protein
MRTIKDKRLGVEYETEVPFSALKVGDILWSPFGYRSHVLATRRVGHKVLITEAIEAGEYAGETLVDIGYATTTTDRYRRNLTSAERGLPGA